jgi:hypothetical protein
VWQITAAEEEEGNCVTKKADPDLDHGLLMKVDERQLLHRGQLAF